MGETRRKSDRDFRAGLRSVPALRVLSEIKVFGHALPRWLSWAARCRIPEFTELAKRSGGTGRGFGFDGFN
jgi:hypothetical protein